MRINMLTLSIYLTKLHIHMHSHPMNLHTNMILQFIMEPMRF